MARIKNSAFIFILLNHKPLYYGREIDLLIFNAIIQHFRKKPACSPCIILIYLSKRIDHYYFFFFYKLVPKQMSQQYPKHIKPRI